MSIGTRTTFTVDVDTWSSSQVARLHEAVAEIVRTPQAAFTPKTSSPVQSIDPETVEDSGWTVEAYAEALRRLFAAGATAQAQVLSAAIQSQDPFVPRERVYELAGYPAERALKGFTRPTNRICGDLVSEGLLPEGAAVLLTAVFDPDAKSYQRTSGFKVPTQILLLMSTESAE